MNIDLGRFVAEEQFDGSGGWLYCESFESKEEALSAISRWKRHTYSNPRLFRLIEIHLDDEFEAVKALGFYDEDC